VLPIILVSAAVVMSLLDPGVGGGKAEEGSEEGASFPMNWRTRTFTLVLGV
jgi:hypothetical protein